MLTRDATPTDRERVAEIGRLAFEPLRRLYRPTPVAKANQAQAQAQSALHRLVAESNGVVVGSVLYREVEDRLHLIGLGVHPDHQRRGAARALVDHAMAIARERRLRAVSLYTVTQTGNPAIFARLGFVVIREAPDTHSESVTGQPLTEAYMERPSAP